MFYSRYDPDEWMFRKAKQSDKKCWLDVEVSLFFYIKLYVYVAYTISIYIYILLAKVLHSKISFYINGVLSPLN